MEQQNLSGGSSLGLQCSVAKGDKTRAKTTMTCCRGPGDIKTKAQTSGEGGGRLRKYLEGKHMGVRWAGQCSQEESRTVRGDGFSCPETGTHRRKGCWPGRCCIRVLGLPRQSPTDWGLKQQIYCPSPGGWKSEMEVSAGGFPRGLRERISSVFPAVAGDFVAIFGDPWLGEASPPPRPASTQAVLPVCKSVPRCPLFIRTYWISVHPNGLT